MASLVNSTSGLEWATFLTALAVLVATAIAAVAAWRSAQATRAAAEASKAAAIATERSASASEAAAEASKEAASSAERQAVAAERSEIAEAMPLVWAREVSTSHGELVIQIGNSGRGVALNPRVWMLRGQLANHVLEIGYPIRTGETDPQEHRLRDPMPDWAAEKPWKVEVRYQDSTAREYAVQISESGATDYYLVVERDGGSVMFEPIISAPPRFP